MTSFEIIIPFYNESHRLPDTLQALLAGFQAKQHLAAGPIRIWWADDGSTDGSSNVLHEALRRFQSPMLSHEIVRREENQGKGSIVRYAIERLKLAAEPGSIVAFWDSDNELDPSGLMEAFQLVQSGQTDLVFGSRFSKLNSQVLNFRHYIGNKLLTLISNYFSNLNLSDVHCCARVMRLELLAKLPLKSAGFDFEAEFVGLVGRIKRPKLKLMEVPILYTPRTVDEGKKIGIAHVLPQILTAIKCRYFRSPIEWGVGLN